MTTYWEPTEWLVTGRHAVDPLALAYNKRFKAKSEADEYARRLRQHGYLTTIDEVRKYGK